MAQDKNCPECGTPLINVSKCREYFDRMITWDFEDFKGVGRVHHLTVLCYHLQHPSHYSPDGLKHAVKILKKVIEKNLSGEKLYQIESDTYSSSQRNWRVTGVETNYGKYRLGINWTTTVAEVVKNGVTEYPDHVEQWARTIYDDLKKAGELQ